MVRCFINSYLLSNLDFKSHTYKLTSGKNTMSKIIVCYLLIKPIYDICSKYVNMDGGNEIIFGNKLQNIFLQYGTVCSTGTSTYMH